MKIIAKIYNDFKTKFAVPRQSGLSGDLVSEIIFEKEFRDPDFIDGIEAFSHLWLIFCFSENKPTNTPKVRPPRLGGNKSVGVFASRSPFRPNPIGLTCVELKKVKYDEKRGPILYVTGADIVSGTPIYDIKPYLAYADSYPDAADGFAETVRDYSLEVVFPDKLLEIIPKQKREGLIKILSEDPRPSYHNDEQRVYGFDFADYEIEFFVKEQVLTVLNVKKQNSSAFE